MHPVTPTDPVPDVVPVHCRLDVPENVMASLTNPLALQVRLRSLSVSVVLSLLTVVAFATTPSQAAVGVRFVVDAAQSDGTVSGNLITDLQVGDRVTVHVEVDNSDQDGVLSLFTSAGFDPSVVIFDGGTSEPVILDEGGFGGDRLNRGLEPELRFGRSDEVLTLVYLFAAQPTSAGTVEIAATITFQVVAQDGTTAISHVLSPFDDSIINGLPNNTDVVHNLEFGSPVLLAVPEPSVSLLIAVGSLGAAFLGRVRARRRG